MSSPSSRSRTIAADGVPDPVEHLAPSSCIGPHRGNETTRDILIRMSRPTSGRVLQHGNYFPSIPQYFRVSFVQSGA